MLPPINTRADLDALVGTPEHAAFMGYLRGTMTRRVNAAVYPDQYDSSLQPGDEGYVAPDWQAVEDLSVIERFGFTKDEMLASATGAAVVGNVNVTWVAPGTILGAVS
jgi:hypothetical protein